MIRFRYLISRFASSLFRVNNSLLVIIIYHFTRDVCNRTDATAAQCEIFHWSFALSPLTRRFILQLQNTVYKQCGIVCVGRAFVTRISIIFPFSYNIITLTQIFIALHPHILANTADCGRMKLISYDIDIVVF